MKRSLKPKIIAIVGPTATGKSDLAVDMARVFGGEIISADSRQVYTGLDIGTGKITRKEMRGVPHHLLDVCSPKRVFTVADYKTLAHKKIADVLSRGKVPIICGGTGFYIQSVVENVDLPEVAPNKALRKKLEAQTTEKLFETLKKLDAKRARTIDQHNRPRLIRAIEIARALGSVPMAKAQPLYDVFQIGIKTEDSALKNKIKARLLSRLRKGMINEAKKLRSQSLSWKRMHDLGLEYRFLALYLQGKIDKKNMIEKLAAEIWKYAKRQKTWFKRDKNIHWYSARDKKLIKKEIARFLRP